LKLGLDVDTENGDAFRVDQDLLRRVADELDVRAVLAEYCLRLEVNDFEEWLDLFTDDCVYEVFRRKLTGRDEIRAMLSQAPAGVHLGGPARVEIDGDVAHTVQNYFFVNGETKETNSGWYFDTLVRTPAGWKISQLILKFQK
jgi:ketosteroid isomerase-like protein